MKTTTLLPFALAVIALCAHASAPAFDLDPFSFRAEGEGIYRAFGTAICAAPPPASATLTLRARIAPERCADPVWAALGLSAYDTPTDYWQLTILRTPDNAGSKRRYELKAMVSSVWGGEKDAATLIERKTFAEWEYGREYDFVLACSTGRIDGTVTDVATGKAVFHCAYALREGAARAWRPALVVNGQMEGLFTGVEADVAASPGGSGVEGRFTGVEADVAASPGGSGVEPPSFAFPPYRPSGPETGLKGTATGFFHMETIDGRDWPIDPTGRAVILAGTQHIKPRGTHSDAIGYSPYGRFVATNYPSVSAWADETLARLSDWGFTFLGNACAVGLLGHKTLPHVQNIQMGQRVCRGDPDWYIREWGFKPCSALPNVFHPQFASACEWRARESCAPFKDDPWLVGWFIDNELAWWGTSKRIESTGLYALVAKLPKTHSARKALDDFLAERGAAVNGGLGGPRPPSFADKVDFLRLYARTYYEKTTAAIRKADPNHMVLGSRYAGLNGAAPVVWEEAGKYCDVVTFNCYPWADLNRGIVLDTEGGVPMTERLREYYGYAKAPLMVTEWSFPALDHGHPCLVGAGQRFRTQAERVEATMLFAKTLLADPHVAGYDYFKWNDQPKTGSSRFSPEDCNYGLVNDFGVPYEGITSAFKELHGNLVRWRSAPPPADKMQNEECRMQNALCERDRFFAATNSLVTPSPVIFARKNDGAWCLSNGLVRLSGRVGEKWMASQVAFADDKPIGRLGALLAAEDNDFYKWIDTTRLASVETERDEATGAVSVLLRGLGGAIAREPPAPQEPPTPLDSPPETDAETPLSFAITMRVTLLPGRSDALVELVSLENLGKAPLLASALYIRAFSNIRQKRAVRPSSAPNLWNAPKAATWALPDGGEWGLSSIDSAVRKFRFFVTTKDGVQHPDAAFSPVLEGKTFTVAPGETWRATIPMGATLFCNPNSN